MTKKRILSSSIIAISILVVAIGGSLLFRSVEKRGGEATTTTQEKPLSSATLEANALIKQAEAAHASKQYGEAADLYRQARTHYKQAADIEKIAEIDAILSLLEVEKNNAPEPVKPKLAGES